MLDIFSVVSVYYKKKLVISEFIVVSEQKYLFNWWIIYINIMFSDHKINSL